MGTYALYMYVPLIIKTDRAAEKTVLDPQFSESFGMYGLFLQTGMALIRLCRCIGIPASSLFVYNRVMSHCRIKSSI